ncbi:MULTISPECIES: PDZ domain-containing protein [Thermodesulfovibrio]|jgi:hypothetical protein|uniref:PDZ domain-containing protein n=1 Tax=Thermodesulfovibrio TaxID=28261 RepID=UPI0026080113|nr:PDZ domain-containing protein [Thermodesulfovibrio sp.]
MFTDKSYTKIVIFLLSIVSPFLIASPSFCDNTNSAAMKLKLDEINREYSRYLIPLQKGIAIPINKNQALVPASAIEDNKNIILALDSKLNLSIVKLNNELPDLNFYLPSKEEEVFLLLTIFEQPVVILVKGVQQTNKINIDGKFPLGSLLLSFDLKPLGIVTKSDTLSEVLLISQVYSEIKKMLNKKPGWLGIQAQTVSKELSKILNVSEGVVITNIYEGGPADKVGISRGDVITEADGIIIRELKDLKDVISNKFSGEKIDLKVNQDGRQKNITVVLEEPPEKTSNMISSQKESIRGLIVSEIPESLKKNLPKSVTGIFIKKIEEDSPALGILKNGDIIMEINKKAVTNVKAFEDIIASFVGRDLLILVYRQDNFQYVIVPQQRVR